MLLKKSEVGSDRIVNAIGALSCYKNCIIIDFGTTTTFDIVFLKNILPRRYNCSWNKSFIKIFE